MKSEATKAGDSDIVPFEQRWDGDIDTLRRDVH